MKLIVGLGNPGEKYQNTRHNIGFMAVDEIVRRHSFSSWSDKFQGVISTGSIASERVIVLKPMTFMNLSGQSVQSCAAFYKISPEDIIVLHDEIELDPLKVRIKTGGGDAGHNGLKDITQRLGTANYKRVRLGVGHPGEKDRVHGHVLGKFAKSEQEDFEFLCSYMADSIVQVLNGDDARAMSDLALKFPKTK